MAVDLRELLLLGKKKKKIWGRGGLGLGMMMGVRMEGWDGVEEMGLVLWWVGDKEMMMLGGKLDVVCLLVGGLRWVLKGV